MVSNVSTLPPATASQTRAMRPAGPDQTQQAEPRAEAVKVDPSRLEHREDVRAARDDVAEARAALEGAVAVGSRVRDLLSEIRQLAQRAADPSTPDAARAAQDVAFRAALQQAGEAVESALEKGVPLIAGDAIAVAADPDSDATFQIPGLDLRLKTAVTGDETLLLARGANIADAAGAGEALRAADRSLARLDEGLRRLSGEADALSRHDALLGALDTALAAAVRTDLGADAARLMALQVRQDLAESTGAIANVRPNAILALFRE